MDLIGLFKTGDPNYLFFPRDEYRMRREVNERQTALTETQARRGLLTNDEATARIAEISNTVVGEIPEGESPFGVFKDEMTTDFTGKFRNSFGNILSQPFKMIPPIGWGILIICGLVYIEVSTGFFRRLLSKK